MMVGDGGDAGVLDHPGQGQPDLPHLRAHHERSLDDGAELPCDVRQVTWSPAFTVRVAGEKRMPLMSIW